MANTSGTQLKISLKAKLNDGNEMPYLGLGVWQIGSGGEAVNAVRTAIEAGYRHVDTAKIYGNEQDVGRAVRDSGVPREEIFVTTKLWNDDQGYDSALKAFEGSLKRLGLEYVDLYLIHWPVQGRRLDSWRALEKLKNDGRCRSVGVSNFTVRHLEELLGVSGLVPAVNQVEFNPFLYQKELLEFCESKKIQLEAYSPLAHGEKLRDPKIAAIGKRHEKSPAQVLIRWCLQHKVVAIPKSSNPQRIRQNADVFNFELDAADMNVLDNLNEDFRTCWDPTELS